MLKNIEVRDAGGAAWRARYVYRGGRKVAHLGIDPNDGVKPTLFGSVGGRSFRVGLPTVPWRVGAGRLYLSAYKASRWFWHGMDGRYGWGSARRCTLGG